MKAEKQFEQARQGRDEVDALLASLSEPALPPRLAQPFAVLLRGQERAYRPAFQFSSRSAWASAAAVVLLLVALSFVLWTANTTDAPATLTPTLTSTLTPTTIAARETGIAVAAFSRISLDALSLAAVPTPAPVPEPRGQIDPLFAASAAHATISH